MEGRPSAAPTKGRAGAFGGPAFLRILDFANFEEFSGSLAIGRSYRNRRFEILQKFRKGQNGPQRGAGAEGARPPLWGRPKAAPPFCTYLDVCPSFKSSVPIGFANVETRSKFVRICKVQDSLRNLR